MDSYASIGLQQSYILRYTKNFPCGFFLPYSPLLPFQLQIYVYCVGETMYPNTEFPQ